MTWKFESKLPVAIQITEKLRREIINGKYRPGEPFPTVRQLALEASVNPNTMQKALSALEGEGLLTGHGTAGRAVTEDVELLEQAGVQMRKEYMDRVLEEARELGITEEMFIRHITERKDTP